MSVRDKIDRIVESFVRASVGIEVLCEGKTIRQLHDEKRQLADQFVAEALTVITDARIVELELTVKTLRQQLRKAQEGVLKAKRHDDYDYLPYPEDDRR